MRYSTLILSAASLALAASSAQAQLTPGRKSIPAIPDPAAQAAPPAPTTPIQLAAGVVVKDTAGGEVGTITAVDAESVTIKTDRHEVRVPLTSVTATPTGALFGQTQAELNAGVDQAIAAQGPLLSVAATVYDVQGGVVGTIEEFDAEYATIKLASEKSVRLPVTAFARGPQGPIIGNTAAELEAAAAGGQ